MRRATRFLVVLLVVPGTLAAGWQRHLYRVESRRLEADAVFLSVAGMATERTGERVVRLRVRNEHSWPIMFLPCVPQIETREGWPNHSRFIRPARRLNQRLSTEIELVVPKGPERKRIWISYESVPSFWRRLKFKLLPYERWVPFRIDLSDAPKVRMTEITLPGD